jgi:hypothetical protein
MMVPGRPRQRQDISMSGIVAFSLEVVLHITF